MVTTTAKEPDATAANASADEVNRILSKLHPRDSWRPAAGTGPPISWSLSEIFPDTAPGLNIPTSVLTEY
jgi:hypothetical protein